MAVDFTAANDRDFQTKKRSLIQQDGTLATPSKVKITYRYLGGAYAAIHPAGTTEATISVWGIGRDDSDPVIISLTDAGVAQAVDLVPCVGDKEQSMVIPLQSNQEVTDVVVEINGMEKIAKLRNIEYFGIPQKIVANEYILE